MYSPKISERLIPVLYHEARARRMPMTKLVDALLAEMLAKRRTTQAPADEAPATGLVLCVAESSPDPTNPNAQQKELQA